MAGRPPFEAKSEQDTCKKIMEGYGKVKVNSKVKGECADFVVGMLKATPSE